MNPTKCSVAVIVLGAVAVLAACGSSKAASSPTTAKVSTGAQTTAAASTTAAAPTTAAGTTVDVTMHLAATGDFTAALQGTFQAPPLGAGTWTQAAEDAACSSAAQTYRFATGDELDAKAVISKTTQSNPPPPAVGSYQKVDVVTTVTGGTGRFAHADGVLRGQGTTTILSFDKATGNGQLSVDGTSAGEVTTGS